MSRDAVDVERALQFPMDVEWVLSQLMAEGREYHQLARDQFAEAVGGPAVDESIRKIQLAELYLSHLKEVWRLHRRMASMP